MKPTLRAVLTFLRSKGGATERGCWWRQKKMAVEIGVPVRSLQRYLAQLEALGSIRVQHRCSTTNLYFVVGKAVEIKPVLACPYAKMANASIELNIQTPKKPAALAVSASGEMPPYQVPNEFGRMIVNPEYARIRDVLHAADDRIRRARDPGAYARAIIARERAS
jgi:hypothetical protein